MEYSGAGGKLIHEKNQKQKISWHCPFKQFQCFLCTTIKYESAKIFWSQIGWIRIREKENGSTALVDSTILKVWRLNQLGAALNITSPSNVETDPVGS